MTKKTDHKIMPGCEPVFREGNKTGVLLLHGFTGSPYEMKELGAHLEEKGYTVSIPLLKGHGTTPGDLIGCNWYDWFEDSKKRCLNCVKHAAMLLLSACLPGPALLYI